MSKIVVDTLQNSGGAGISFPTAAPVNGQVLASVTGNPGQLGYTAMPATPTVTNPWPTGIRPVLFAINTCYQNGATGSYGWSSEQGQWYNGQGATKLSIGTGRTAYSWSNATNYSNYSQKPMLSYLTADSGNFAYAREQTTVQNSSNQYNYPDKLLVTLFVKNTTGSDITSTFYNAGACYWNSGYEGANVCIAVPDATNTQIAANANAITSLNYTDIWSYSTNNSAYAVSNSITVPADKTIAIIVYTSGRYYSSNYGYYFQNFIKVYNMNSFLVAGLEVDAARTIRAIQNPNRLGNTTTALYDIWK